MPEEKLQEIKVLVPTERIAQFYAMVARWLEGPADEETVVSGRKPWSDDDLPLAEEVWGRMNQWSRELFAVFMDSPGQRVSGEQLAEDLHYKNGKYGIVGVMGWPGRYCRAVGRAFPVQWEEGPAGKSGNYWMTPKVAALFRKARDGE
jgi:hypothetical protein